MASDKSKLMKKTAKSIARELEALNRMKDEDIDLSDIPEIRDFSKAVVGKFYRPRTETVTISPKFQVVIPRALRESLRIRPGQKVQMILYQNRIELVPLQPMKKARGFLKGIGTRIEREPDRL